MLRPMAMAMQVTTKRLREGTEELFVCGRSFSHTHTHTRRYAAELRESLAKADPEDKRNARERRRQKRLAQKERLRQEMVWTLFTTCVLALAQERLT